MTEGFAAIPNWVVRDEDVSIYAISVYVALATHTGPGGIHPSQATLAKEARCSERQVRVALNELEALGVVERVRRKSDRGRATNGYVLHPHGRLGPDEEPEEVAASHAVTPEVPAHSDRGSGTRAHLVPLIEEEPIKKSAQSRGSRLSGEWMPSAELLAWVVVNAPSVEPLRETEVFRDWWIAAPGAKGVKQDWNATWRNWMRRSHDRNVERGWKPGDDGLGREEWMLR